MNSLVLGVNQVRDIKMKICIVTPTLSGGGAQKVAVNLANEWSQQGLNVELIVLRNTGVYFAQVGDKVNLTVLGVKRIRYALIPLGNAWLPQSPMLYYL